MSYVVEVPVSDADFADRMNQMRAWLDHRRFEPSAFRLSAQGDQPGVCLVHFRSESEAAAFIREFGGRLQSTPPSAAVIR